MQAEFSSSGSDAAPEGPSALSSDEIAKLFQIASPPAVQEAVAPERDVETLLTERAAVVGAFTPQSLVGGLEATDSLRSALQGVLDKSVEVINGDRRQWVLEPSARTQTLARLGTSASEVLSSFQLNMGGGTGSTDDLSRTLEGLFRGEEPKPDDLETSSLRTLVNAAAWCTPESGGTDIRLPQWRKILEQRELLTPFRNLLGDNFVGREPEIKALRAHVGVVAPESTFEGWSRWLSDALSFGPRNALFIHGMGGVGKSTLMAKFIVEHAAALGERAFPFVYLDFDRASLDPMNPLTLLSEIARQVGVQFPELSDDLEVMRRSHQHASEHSRIEQRSRSSASSGERVGNLGFAIKASYEFMERISSHDIGGRPFLLVLDTFEEVQARGELAVDAVFNWLKTMEKISGLRVVIAGRAPNVGQSGVKNRPLGNLGKTAAHSLLAKEGLSAEQAKQIFDRVGGNPLSMRLAVRLLKADGNLSSLDSIGTTSVFKSLDDILVQGVLYTRLLKKIVDPEVQKLANPGLVLRRITPDLIVEVLAPIVGMGAISQEQAQALYEKLKLEVTLVVEDGGALVHRKDVREVMLSLQQKENPVQFEALNRSAAAYYRQRQGQLPDASVELAYHRLMLGEPPLEVLCNLPRQAAAKLVPGVSELPRNASIFLRAVFGKYLAKSDVKDLSDEAWELYVFQRVRQLIDAGTPEPALELLDERKTGQSMPLVMLARASVYFNLLEWDRASDAFTSACRKQPEDTALRSFAVRPGELEVRPFIEHGFLQWFRQEGDAAVHLFSEARDRIALRADEGKDDDPLMRLEALLGYKLSSEENRIQNELTTSAASELADQAESTTLAVWRMNLSALRRMVLLGTPGTNTMSAAVMLFGLRVRSANVAQRFLEDCGMFLDRDLYSSFEKLILEDAIPGKSIERFHAQGDVLAGLEARAAEALVSRLGEMRPALLRPYLRGRFAPWRQGIRTAIIHSLSKSGFINLLEDNFGDVAGRIESAKSRDFRDLADSALDAAEETGQVLELVRAVVSALEGEAGAPARRLLGALQRYTGQAG